METKKIAQQEMKWAKGYKVTVRDWIRFCELSSDKRFQNLFYSLSHGLETGRLPNWERGFDFEKYFTKNNKRMSNVQVRNALSEAAELQESLNTAAGLKALQKVFGINTR